jgi:hypothetical protein
MESLVFSVSAFTFTSAENIRYLISQEKGVAECRSYPNLPLLLVGKVRITRGNGRVKPKGCEVHSK